MVTLPFAPAASAFLTAVDVLAISSQSAFEDLIMPGVAAQVRETLARVDTLERDIAAKLAQVSALQAELAAVRARVELERAQPRKRERRVLARSVSSMSDEGEG